MKRQTGAFLRVPAPAPVRLGLVEMWFVPSDGRPEQRWLGPTPFAERYPGYGARTVKDKLEPQMAFGAGRLELREVVR